MHPVLLPAQQVAPCGPACLPVIVLKDVKGTADFRPVQLGWHVP